MTSEKTYKAYPGLIGMVFVLPWFLPFVLVPLIGIRLLVTGEGNRAIGIIMMVIITLAIKPLFVSLGVVRRTSLKLSDEGILYDAVEISRCNFYKPRVVELKASWENIREVRWVGLRNDSLFIKTDHGGFTFKVRFQPRTNAEIMNEILSRVPHLRAEKQNET